ncbi:MAG: hypothetical protein NT049_05125, partial [Planctomycetota bacterium]|nr:hypothetical protein [Planctomycetota bacterium]
AYFMWERYEPLDKAPQLVHVVLFLEGHEPRDMRNFFAHEGTHAFVVMFRRGEPLPLWLHEGMAMYMSAVNDPPLGPSMWKHVQAKVLSGVPYGHLVTNDKLTQLTADEYMAAYAMVDYLCKLGGQKSFRQFMIQLKEGKEQDAALKSVYRYDRTEFVKQWQKYVAGLKMPQA